MIRLAAITRDRSGELSRASPHDCHRACWTTRTDASRLGEYARTSTRLDWRSVWGWPGCTISPNEIR